MCLVVNFSGLKASESCSTDLVYDQSISCLCTILEIQLPKLDSSRHRTVHTLWACTLHFMHYIYFCPENLLLRRDAIIYQNIEKKGKEKMANKGWIVTIFAFKSENMALNRFYKVWTLFTHVHFPHQKTFGILHLIMIISSWMHLRAANPLSIRCAHMCYRYTVELIKKNG